jgi:hypothetical protein
MYSVVETEVNEDSKSTPAPVQHIFFNSPYAISMHLFPSPGMLGRQSCWVACLLLCVSEQRARLSVSFVRPRLRLSLFSSLFTCVLGCSVFKVRSDDESKAGISILDVIKFYA